ncbi:helicase associated domain-containing protein [Streptomyces sp. NPDC127117]|uniref:helicase associated domain-containing protein n=1 Tax=Streptomyces sp. NPDC127117 TaxID=3345368 RepID=UPI00362B5FE4
MPTDHVVHGLRAVNLAAARQFHTPEGLLRVPREQASQVEMNDGPGGRRGGADEVMGVKLGTWLDNVRNRAVMLTEQRRADLDALGLRW